MDDKLKRGPDILVQRCGYKGAVAIVGRGNAKPELVKAIIEKFRDDEKRIEGVWILVENSDFQFETTTAMVAPPIDMDFTRSVLAMPASIPLSLESCGFSVFPKPYNNISEARESKRCKYICEQMYFKRGTPNNDELRIMKKFDLTREVDGETRLNKKGLGVAKGGYIGL